MDIDHLKDSLIDLVNTRLDELAPVKTGPQQRLFEAARYSLLGSGKRIRPLLVLSVLQGFNVPMKLGLDPACAIELVHTYSLIHDDLPCMDNDDLRRGRPTLHKVYPEGLAVLAGDFLLTYAFEVICQSTQLLAKQKLDLILSLSKRSGAHGMIGGQVVDIASEGVEIDWEMLHFMHLHKTAALFTSCLEFGGIVCQVNSSDLTILQNCGKALGVAYQVIDDIIDEIHSSDRDLKKATTITVLGKNRAEELAHMLIEEALKEAKQLTLPCHLLVALIKEIYSYLPTKVKHV